MAVSFSCVCPVIDNEFRQNIVKWIHSYINEIQDQKQDRRVKSWR